MILNMPSSVGIDIHQVVLHPQMTLIVTSPVILMEVTHHMEAAVFSFITHSPILLIALIMIQMGTSLPIARVTLIGADSTMEDNPTTQMTTALIILTISNMMALVDTTVELAPSLTTMVATSSLLEQFDASTCRHTTLMGADLGMELMAGDIDNYLQNLFLTYSISQELLTDELTNRFLNSSSYARIIRFFHQL